MLWICVSVAVTGCGNHFDHTHNVCVCVCWFTGKVYSIVYILPRNNIRTPRLTFTFTSSGDLAEVEEQHKHV